ncbi:MAG: UbiA family prenyltransferase [Candidatus Iainarchaeum archaeon]|uniref:UbiA family prenyltransferase n=1 Tax=Candidatus Iainarchaeum sp. TaxID=3101447 RepID=A0A7T9DKJ0_9ARCH|nr:MAG: UbiA family prenyltransferase [Candidatus Diapherotrites archaeon]
MKTNPLPFLSAEQKGQLENEQSKSVIVADMDGNVVGFNPGAQDIFGYTAKEAIGMHVRLFHPKQNYARILPELFRTALQKGKYDAVIPLIRKNGKEFPGHIIVTQVKDTQNQVVGLIGVTEEVRALPVSSTISKWIQALRAPFFSATLIPVFLGTAIAFHATGLFSFWPFFWTVLGMLCIHAGVNMANDYYDHRSGNDALNQHPTPFSGGSRVIQDGIFSADTIKWVSFSFLALGALIGLYINSLIPGNKILFIGLLGMGIGFFYSAPPFAASYRRFGELFVGVGFGPLIVVGSYIVQTGMFSWIPLLVSIPIGLLIAGVLFLNEFPDAEADIKVGKRNIVNSIGKKSSVHVLAGGIILAFAIIAGLILARVIPIWTAGVFLAIPLAWKTITHTQENYDTILELIPANASMITLNFVFGALLTLAFLAGTWL